MFRKILGLQLIIDATQMIDQSSFKKTTVCPLSSHNTALLVWSNHSREFIDNSAQQSQSQSNHYFLLV